MSNLISVNLDDISRYMLDLHQTEETAKSPKMIRNRIINCQELLGFLGITVEAFKDCGGHIYEVRAYQVSTTTIYDKVGMHHAEMED